MTSNEFINKMLRKEIEVKQRQLVIARLGNEYAELKRIEKSIALRVQKLLCEHEGRLKLTPGRNGRAVRMHRCDKCRSSFVEIV